MERSRLPAHGQPRGGVRLVLILLDAVWLAMLAVYAFGGLSLVPLHGDEPEHLYSSRDFATYFLDGRPDLLAVQPPYPADSDSYIRIQTGTVTDYLFGLGWHVAGFGPSDMPVTWTWWDDYKENVALGAVPAEAVLLIGRTISTWLFALSIVALFGLARQLGGRWLAFLASALYAINPIILANTRRAFTEGALFCFGLLTLFLALTIVRRQTRGRAVPWAAWLGLGVFGALAIASKFSGIIFVAVAGAWIVISWLRHFSLAKIGALSARLAAAGVVGVLVFLALTPALWRDPLNRFADLIQFHKAVLDGIALDAPDGATTLPQRIVRVVATPFIAPPTYFEAANWADYRPIARQVRAYDASWLRGFEPGTVAGGALTGLMLAGLVALFLPSPLRVMPFDSGAGLALWYVAMAANSLVNPLPWDRYDMLVTPISILLTGIGLWQLAHFASITSRRIRLKRLHNPL